MTETSKRWLRADLIRDEGQRLMPYVDTVGKTSIGVGRNLTDIGISQAVCDLMLDEDIARAISGAEGFAWFAGLNEVRQRVIVNMTFNLGYRGVMAFEWMGAALAKGDYAAAAKEMLSSRWAEQTGARAQRLAEMMATGRDLASGDSV